MFIHWAYDYTKKENDMGVQLKNGQKWKNNNSGVIGTVSDYDFFTVTLDVVYASGRAATLVVDKPLTQSWSLVTEEPMKIELNDKLKGTGDAGSIVEVIWVKEDGSKFLVRGKDAEWLIDRETVRKYWTKIVPETLPANTTRISTRTEKGYGEDTIQYVDTVFGASNKIDIVTSADAGVLLVNKGDKPAPYSTFLSTEVLEFILAERKRYETEKNN